MYIHEAAKVSGTTKKAIEYYCRKGLLSPQFTENGYNTVFIPAMRRLSPAYDEYMIKLQKADRVFSLQYQMC